MTERPTAGGTYPDVFQLLHRAEQRAKALFARETARSDLTLRQAVILQAIRDGGTVIQSDIVQVTGIDRSTVTELLGRLDRRELITRVRHRQDARAYLVTLTAQGERLLEDANSASVRAAELFIEVLPEADRQKFLDNLRAAAGVNETDPA